MLVVKIVKVDGYGWTSLDMAHGMRTETTFRRSRPGREPEDRHGGCPTDPVRERVFDEEPVTGMREVGAS